MKVERICFNNFLESVETTARVCTDTSNKGNMKFALSMWEKGHGTPFEHNTFAYRRDDANSDVWDEYFGIIPQMEALGYYQPAFRLNDNQNVVKGSFRAFSTLGLFAGMSMQELLSTLEWCNTRDKGTRRTFLVETNIGIAREILRHRSLSFTERSTRYVKEHCALPTYKDLDILDGILSGISNYEALREDDIPRDYAREVLTLGTATSFYITGWEDQLDEFVRLRTGSTVHHGAKYIASEVERLIKEDK